VRSPADLRRLRYVPARHLRPDLPAWVDAVLAKALSPQPDKRQAVISEFVQDLKAPGAQFQHRRVTPLIDRDPVLFWKGSTALLGLAVVALLALRAFGH
jgi:hypothetical protein